jgi:hypothetical protein
MRNELCLCGDRAVTEPTTQSPRAGRGVTPGPEACPRRERPRAGQTWPVAGSLHATASRRGGDVGARFSQRRPGRETEKLTACPWIQIPRFPDSQIPRFPGFQVFRFSPLHLPPEILPSEPLGRGHGAGNVLNPIL